MNGYPGCFHFLVIMNRTAMNLNEQVSLFQDIESFGIWQGVRELDHFAGLFVVWMAKVQKINGNKCSHECGERESTYSLLVRVQTGEASIQISAHHIFETG